MNSSPLRTLRQRLHSETPQIRRAALTQLDENFERVSVPAADLLPFLHDEDSSHRWLAIHLLAKIGDVAALPPLLAATLDPDEAVAEAARDALAAFRSPDALDAFIHGAGQLQPGIRALAVAALGEIGHPRAVPILLHTCGDLANAVRAAAITALGRLRDQRALGAIRWGLYDDASLVRRAAVAAGASFPDPTLPENLVRLLDDPSLSVRSEVAAVLVRFPGQTSIGLLLHFLHDAEPAVVRIALQSLCALRAPVAEHFTPLLEHSLPEIRFAAQAALRHVGFHPRTAPTIPACDSRSPFAASSLDTNRIEYWPEAV